MERTDLMRLRDLLATRVPEEDPVEDGPEPRFLNNGDFMEADELLWNNADWLVATALRHFAGEGA